ncbi:hypothetical protein, partial [Pluralibacter gergoviae]
SRPRPWQGRALPTELFPQLNLLATKKFSRRYGRRIIREFETSATPDSVIFSPLRSNADLIAAMHTLATIFPPRRTFTA